MRSGLGGRAVDMTTGEPIEGTSRALTRRNALKVGAAAGVGAAAWTGPKLGIFGASPAYAGMCSPGEEGCYTAGSSVNFGADCEDNSGGKYAEFNNVRGTVTLGGLSATISAPNGSDNGSKLCSLTQSPLRVVASGGLRCRARLVVELRGGGQDIQEITGTGTFDLPIPPYFRAANDQEAGTSPVPLIVHPNSRWSLSFCCTTDPDPGDCDLLP